MLQKFKLVECSLAIHMTQYDCSLESGSKNKVMQRDNLLHKLLERMYIFFVNFLEY